MKTVKILKGTLPVVASIGVGAVVGTILKSVTPLEASTITKVSFGIGAFVLTSMAGDAAATYTSNYIDETERQFRNLKDAVAEVKHAAES